ncbi:hypothetical protein TL16_g00819 [Triparma laevis f. inornata]|uniref:Uncharacterized protein n=1 Tax=Triparma laevis f. inornata TaxID=1714386 RepID=A0A9W6ZHE4_9STRA|nr:hypothetical protein TL16_g00819 [Triparma laevis f. inornata]
MTSTTLALGSFSGSISILHSSSLSSFSLTQTLQGQESEIKSLSYTPSADILASSSRDKTLWLWDTQTYEPLSILSSHTGDVKSCLFLTPLKIASCGYDGLLKIWEEDEDGDWSQTQNLEPEKGEELGDDTLWCIGGMGSSYRIFVGNGKGEVIVYQDENGRYEEIGRIEGNNEECYEVNLPSVKAGHCGILRTGGMGFEVFREKSSFGQIDGEKFRKDCEVKYAHDGEVNCVKWCRGGERVVSVGDDGRVRVWKYDIG